MGLWKTLSSEGALRKAKFKWGTSRLFPHFLKKEGWSDNIEITSDEDVVTIMANDDKSKTSLVNMDNRHYKRYVYGNPKREQEIRNIYKISSTIMGLWLLEQVDKGGLEESKRRGISNSLGRLLLPMVDSLGSKLAELEQA